jgi:hypothetical protein
MRPHLISTILLSLALCINSACTVPKKEAPDIKTNGFVNDNCYQAILVFEPDPGAAGLVAKRESAYLKAKKADLKDLTLEHMASYCIDHKLQSQMNDKSQRETVFYSLKNDVLNKLKPLAGDGSISFVYYNEKNILFIGFHILKQGLKQKVAILIDSIVIKNLE